MQVNVWIAVAAGLPGVIALIALAFLWRAQSRLRAGQQVLLPDGASASLLDRQAALQRAMARVEEGLSDLESLVERQGEVTERGLRTSLRFQGMVRYDAYRDMGGAQSWSVALLDGNRTGSIITSLHARDHARVYLKEMVDGVPGQRLSPEEQRAVELALARPPEPTRVTDPSVPRDPQPPDAPPAADHPTGEFPHAGEPERPPET